MNHDRTGSTESGRRQSTVGVTLARDCWLALIMLAVSGPSICLGQALEPIIYSPVAVRWQLLTNFTNVPDGFEASFELRHGGDEPLGDQGWGLYFNMAPRPIVPHPEPQPASIEHLNGDWYRLVPSAGFLLEPGQTVQIRYAGIEPVIKESDAPLGLYFAFDTGAPDRPRIERVLDYRIEPFTRAEQINRGPEDQQPIPTAAQRYQDNLGLHYISPADLPLLVPTPLSVRSLESSVRPDAVTIQLTSHWEIRFDDGLQAAAERLAESLADWFGLQCDIIPASQRGLAAAPTIRLSTQPMVVNGVQAEAYRLRISDTEIELVGSDQAGLFYATQSLLQLAPVGLVMQPRAKPVTLPRIEIHDAPRFGYRGLHVDVSRNFQSVETIQRILDVMALYKLNRLLLYTTEDEGWRVEIPGLPELTSVGAQRQHNAGMHHPSLHPAYGSGPDAYGPGSHGSGYYTRAEFIDLLRYAAQRHIKIIPEVNFPGHARAAIKAMEARYERLMAEGRPEAAEEYRLIDPLDNSDYLSAQAYRDNVVSVARPSTYRFYHKVLDELSAMYAEAGLVMDEIHTGGDEVPEGSWAGSPMAAELFQQQPEVGGVQNLQTYFFRRLLTELEQRGLKALGWEEVFQRKDAAGQAEPNPEFVGRNVVAYIWNNLFDYDLGNRLANIGYPVVLCNVSNFYFDLAYDKDPLEPGLYWAGFVNERDAWTFAPYNYMLTTFRTSMGQPIDIDAVQARYLKLQPEARANILGVQAQLWSETIKGREMIEYYMLPKLIGFAESAWAAERPWERIADRAQREQSMAEGWNVMANVIGQRELPRLARLRGGYNYRVPPPGAIIQDGQLKANTAFPGLIIRFTTDGSEPTLQSDQLHRLSVVLGVEGQTIKLRAFDSAGRASRVVQVP